MQALSVMSSCNRKKTIIAKSILGRLGNQMFQYAYCRAIKEMTGGSLAFSFDKVLRQKEVDKNKTGFEDSLCYFNVEEYEIFNGNPLQKYSNRAQVFLYRSAHYIKRKLFKGKKWQTLFSKIGLFHYNDKDNDFYKDIVHIKKNSIFQKLIIFPPLFFSAAAALSLQVKGKQGFSVIDFIFKFRCLLPELSLSLALESCSLFHSGFLRIFCGSPVPLFQFLLASLNIDFSAVFTFPGDVIIVFLFERIVCGH